MPIRGLTKDVLPTGGGLPRICTLYKGSPKRERRRQDGSTYLIMGEDLKYFRVEFEPPFEHLRPIWQDLYGDKPDSFYGVFLAGRTTDEAFPTWREEWDGAGTLLHRCDGDNQVLWFDRRTGQMCSFKEQCAANAETPCKCTNVGRLNLLLPEFIEASGALGYASVSTHSLNDILTIDGYLRSIEALNNGTLWGVPFTFGRAARQMSAPETDRQGNRTGKRMKVSKSLLHLYADEQFTKRELLPKFAGAVALPSGDENPGAGLTADTSEARKLLGGGDKPRRMGGAITPPSNKWTVDQTTAFFTYARERHHLTQAQALDLLDVVSLADFEGDLAAATVALDAVIAEIVAAESASS